MESTYIVLIVVAVLLGVAGYIWYSKSAAKPTLPEEQDEPKKPTLPPKSATSADSRKVSPKEEPERPAKADHPPKTSPPKVSDPPKKVVEVAPPREDKAPVAKEAASPEPPKVHKKDVAKVRKGLERARGGFIAKLAALFTGKKEIDPSIVDQVEEVLLAADVGVPTTESILARIREGLSRKELSDDDAVWGALKKEALRILKVGANKPLVGKLSPSVVLVVGVNGVGKTTTIGKLGTRVHADGKSVMLAAGDTFRAAAVAQLEIWGKRIGAEVVRGKDGADPAAVAFDATNRAKEEGTNILFVDTAGRLHTKAPLMDEIRKVKKTIGKAMDGAPHETLLVLDATTGQNALAQAKLFQEAVEPTGIVLSKLDGTAKGGIVLAICDELKIPVRFVGLGERAEDLREFDAEEFVDALFDARDELTAETHTS